MSMKPGATTSPLASIDPSAPGLGAQTPDGDDPVAADRHVAVKPGIAGAVDDLACPE